MEKNGGEDRHVVEIRVRGLVQGVGFRPFVWRLANDKGFHGDVRNDAEGVLIRLSGEPDEIVCFAKLLQSEAPPLARVETVDISPSAAPLAQTGFRIAESRDGRVATGIVPDAATCPECLAETFDPADRRYRYPFTNCTHCGPRLSIVNSIPYDRGRTSMKVFTMCPACRSEYEDPADRRFHAQPNACPECGPRVWLEEGGAELELADPLTHLAKRIAAGDIAAVKGIGGFHLAVDAANAEAVAELRRRKRRPHKPLALMARDLNQIRRYCEVDESEATLLQNKAAPVVLLRSKGETLADRVAPGQEHLGFMLPYTPLHHLLMRALDGPVVLTSGNLSSDPQVTSNEAARTQLAGIADLMLLHDREIVNRLDDSVVRLQFGKPSYLRRARGYAPGSVRLPPSLNRGQTVLAMGGELKAAFCMARNGEAVLSQHIGDLENAPTLQDYFRMMRLYRDIYAFKPEVIAVDPHQDYLSTQEGRRLAREEELPLVAVQHHHAHLAAVLADNGCEAATENVLGIILDGTGLGTDGTNWGGEFLLGGYRSFDRAGCLAPVRLPGGAAAVREPWRNLCAHLHAAFGPGYGEFLDGVEAGRRLKEKPLSLLDRMMQQGINSPMSSSAGRLFDAVAALLGLCFDRQTFEGQAGALLEAAARRAGRPATAYPMEILAGGGPARLGCDGLWRGLLEDLAAGVDTDQLAANFHASLIEGLRKVATRIAGEQSTGTVALSGGVFQNEVLLSGLARSLQAAGLDVLTHRNVPANDGGLALGQAAVASLR
ncbi:carbamoyltransferase HypF [Roseibium sp.]|uniref:carbamoyltransferase HypF n=1 Tax=Roseibium sp. TaxID=1936156 RepID=UPI003D10EB35